MDASRAPAAPPSRGGGFGGGSPSSPWAWWSLAKSSLEHEIDEAPELHALHLEAKEGEAPGNGGTEGVEVGDADC